MQEHVAINETDKRYVVFQSEDFKVQKEFGSTTSFGLIKNKEACQKIRQYNIYCEGPTTDSVNVALRVGKHDDATQNGFGFLHIQNKHDDLIDYFYEHFANNNSLSSHAKNREIKDLIAEVINSLNTGGIAKQVVLAFSPQDQRFIVAVEFNKGEEPLYIACILYPTGPSLLEIITMYAISDVEFEEFKQPNQAGQRNFSIYQKTYTPQKIASPKKESENKEHTKADENTQVNNDNNVEKASDIQAAVIKKKKTKKKKKAKDTTAALLPQLNNNKRAVNQKEMVVKDKKESCASFTELMLDNVFEMPKYFEHHSNKAYAPILKDHVLLYGDLTKLDIKLKEVAVKLLAVNDRMSKIISVCQAFAQDAQSLSDNDFGLFTDFRYKDFQDAYSRLQELAHKSQLMVAEFEAVKVADANFKKRLNLSDRVKGVADSPKLAKTAKQNVNSSFSNVNHLLAISNNCLQLHAPKFAANESLIQLLNNYTTVIVPFTRADMIRTMLSVFAILMQSDNLADYAHMKKTAFYIYKQLRNENLQNFIGTDQERELLVKIQSDQCEALMQALGKVEATVQIPSIAIYL